MNKKLIQIFNSGKEVEIPCSIEPWDLTVGFDEGRYYLRIYHNDKYYDDLVVSEEFAESWAREFLGNILGEIPD